MRFLKISIIRTRGVEAHGEVRSARVCLVYTHAVRDEFEFLRLCEHFVRVRGWEFYHWGWWWETFVLPSSISDIVGRMSSGFELVFSR